MSDLEPAINEEVTMEEENDGIELGTNEMTDEEKQPDNSGDGNSGELSAMLGDDDEKNQSDEEEEGLGLGLELNDETETEKCLIEWVKISNLTRPFTLGSLQRRIESAGAKFTDPKQDLWLNSIKSCCFVRLDNHAEIITSFTEELNGKPWPESNPKNLEITIVSQAQKEREVYDDENPNEKDEKVKKPSRESTPPNKKSEKTNGDGQQTVPKRDRSRSPVRRAKSRTPSPCPSPPPRIPQEELDSLFRKTKTEPVLYWKMADPKPPKKEEEEEMKDQDAASEAASDKKEEEETKQETVETPAEIAATGEE